ncbi:hypothetical protein ACF0H5_003867 [Mactra antiquata]
MADLKQLLCFSCLLVSVYCDYNADVSALVARIEQLELRDAAKQRKINELEDANVELFKQLKQRDATQQRKINELEDANVELFKQLKQRDAVQQRKINELEDANVELFKQLERRDAVQQLKIGELEAKEERLKLELTELKVQLESKSCECDKQLDNGTFMDKEDITDDDNRKHKNREVRMAPEEEIAFYATHTQHDILHLGANQVLTFDNIVTNIGNAYSHYSGVFKAPVQGTYVFHATVMGRSVHDATHNKYAAHFDVDGVGYSMFWVSAYDQSSQMLIIDLKPGQSVSIRNEHIDEGFIGAHYTTFSGFLLFQHDTVGAIIGK